LPAKNRRKHNTFDSLNWDGNIPAFIFNHIWKKLGCTAAQILKLFAFHPDFAMLSALHSATTVIHEKSRKEGRKMAADIASIWTNFLTQMVGLSMAAERVTETVKQWVASSPTNIQQAARRSGLVQLIAIGSGILVVGLSGLNPIGIPGFAPFSFSKESLMCWLVTGLLVSGGSAFWNHLLDILKATKIEKEQAADATAVSAGRAPIPS
jgi:hypothetical protein